MDKQSFGRFVAEKRMEKGFTQAQLAEALYITETAVSKWERGVTYPDITLIPALCEKLGVSEHELITACNDDESRRMRKESKRYRFISNSWFWGWTIAYAAALVVCFIVNLAVQKRLSWFFIVLTSLLTAFSLVPSASRFVKSKKVLWISGSFLVSLSLLILTCNIYTGEHFFLITFVSLLFAYSVVFTPIFIHLYVPVPAVRRHNAFISLGIDVLLLFLLIFIALNGDKTTFLRGAEVTAYCILPVAATIAVLAYLKVNGCFKASLIIILWGIFLFFVNNVVALIFSQPLRPFSFDFRDWETCLDGNIHLIILLSATLIAIAFFIVGLARHFKRKEAKN